MYASYLEAMIKVFTDCSERTISKFNELVEGPEVNGQKSIELDLEAEFSSLALDIIGLGVFNYDFGSVTKESPVIKVCLSKIACQRTLHAAFIHFVFPNVTLVAYSVIYCAYILTALQNLNC